MLHRQQLGASKCYTAKTFKLEHKPTSESRSEVAFKNDIKQFFMQFPDPQVLPLDGTDSIANNSFSFDKYLQLKYLIKFFSAYSTMLNHETVR